jgi:hypothetical protein
MVDPKANNVPIAPATGRSARDVLLGAGCEVVLPACGSTSLTGYHNPRYPYGAPNVPASMSKCMRASAVPNSPIRARGRTAAAWDGRSGDRS